MDSKEDFYIKKIVETKDIRHKASVRVLTGSIVSVLLGALFLYLCGAVSGLFFFPLALCILALVGLAKSDLKPLDDDYHHACRAYEEYKREN